MHVDDWTKLIVALTGLVGAVNLILNLVLKGKVHTVKDLVNGRMDEVIQAHRADAYNKGFSDASAPVERRAPVSESQPPGNLPP